MAAGRPLPAHAAGPLDPGRPRGEAGALPPRARAGDLPLPAVKADALALGNTWEDRGDAIVLYRKLYHSLFLIYEVYDFMKFMIVYL